jgi:hypothetical protein
VGLGEFDVLSSPEVFLEELRSLIGPLGLITAEFLSFFFFVEILFF